MLSLKVLRGKSHGQLGYNEYFFFSFVLFCFFPWLVHLGRVKLKSAHLIFEPKERRFVLELPLGNEVLHRQALSPIIGQSVVERDVFSCHFFDVASPEGLFNITQLRMTSLAFFAFSSLPLI